MLDYLRKHHDISTKTIYNDLLGFIENRRIHKSVYTEFFKGSTCEDRGDSEKEPAKKQAWYDKAIAHYGEVIALNPEFAIAYNGRGLAYAKKGEFDIAIQDYDKAIELNPADVDAYCNRGNAYDDRGDFDRAIQDYDKAIELNTKHANTYYNRGLAYRRKGDFDRAIQDFDKAIALDPEDDQAFRARARALLSMKARGRSQ